MENIDKKTVASFGEEWSRFDQLGMTDLEARKIFEDYFAIFPWASLPSDATGFDMGCGSGRWAQFVAPKVGHLYCIDPSTAIQIAERNLAAFDNISFHMNSVGQNNLKSGSQDFGYSLGVLHHVPDTSAAIQSCAQLLKPGAPLLLYLYYKLDNRPFWFRALWKTSDIGRKLICLLPSVLKFAVTDLIAALVYWPLARLSLLLDWLGVSVAFVPLSSYRRYSFYTMRTDSRDRFGTPLEKRFTRNQIEIMMRAAGLVHIRFSDRAPYWCVVGIKG